MLILSVVHILSGDNLFFLFFVLLFVSQVYQSVNLLSVSIVVAVHSLTAHIFNKRSDVHSIIGLFHCIAEH